MIGVQCTQSLHIVDLTGTGPDLGTAELGEILSQIESAAIPESATVSAGENKRESEQYNQTATPTPCRKTHSPIVLINLVSPVKGSPEERKSSAKSRLQRLLSLKKATLSEKASADIKARLEKEKATRTGSLHVGALWMLEVAVFV